MQLMPSGLPVEKMSESVLLKGTLARDFGLPFFIIKRMLLVP